MASAEALTHVRGYALAGRIVVTPHARRRMRERGVLFDDLRHALVTATACLPEPGGRWRVKGSDASGDELSVVVAIEDGLVVVTLF